MAQPNLAREPSMDEILASIRKIIESNETIGPGQPANDQGPLPESFFDTDRTYVDEDSAEEIQLTIDESVFPDYEDAFIAPQREHVAPPVSAPATPAPVAAVPSAPLSLADVAARVRAASERQSAPREVAPREVASREVAAREAQSRDMPLRDVAPSQTTSAGNGAASEPKLEIRIEPPATQAVAEAQRTEAVASEPAPVEPEQTGREQSPAVTQPVEQPQTRAETRTAADAQQTSPAPERPVARPAPADAVKDVPAIVSEAVGDQVARSFNDLALALDSSARRSFDEIAEDMLRPMLQEWLDDNLPTLVERLVREEIERVARGPRR